MRAAPPCTVRLADGRAERAVLILLHVLAAAVAAHWAMGQIGAAGWPVAVTWLLAGLAGAAVGTFWAVQPLRPGAGALLHWSGRVWLLQPLSARGADPAARPLDGLSIAIDAGPWMLLRARPAGQGDLWLIARPGAAGGPGWAALRIALAAHAGTAVAPPASAVG